MSCKQTVPCVKERKNAILKVKYEVRKIKTDKMKSYKKVFGHDQQSVFQTRTNNQLVQISLIVMFLSVIAKSILRSLVIFIQDCISPILIG